MDFRKKSRSHYLFIDRLDSFNLSDPGKQPAAPFFASFLLSPPHYSHSLVEGKIVKLRTVAELGQDCLARD